MFSFYKIVIVIEYTDKNYGKIVNVENSIKLIKCVCKGWKACKNDTLTMLVKFIKFLYLQMLKGF